MIVAAAVMRTHYLTSARAWRDSPAGARDGRDTVSL